MMELEVTEIFIHLLLDSQKRHTFSGTDTLASDRYSFIPFSRHTILHRTSHVKILPQTFGFVDSHVNVSDQPRLPRLADSKRSGCTCEVLGEGGW